MYIYIWVRYGYYDRWRQTRMRRNNEIPGRRAMRSSRPRTTRKGVRRDFRFYYIFVFKYSANVYLRAVPIKTFSTRVSHVRCPAAVATTGRRESLSHDPQWTRRAADVVVAASSSPHKSQTNNTTTAMSAFRQSETVCGRDVCPTHHPHTHTHPPSDSFLTTFDTRRTNV